MLPLFFVLVLKQMLEKKIMNPLFIFFIITHLKGKKTHENKE
jgi:hypothetical protein